MVQFKRFHKIQTVQLFEIIFYVNGFFKKSSNENVLMA